jgi:adenosylhomocysteine nucleosidase
VTDRVLIVSATASEAAYVPPHLPLLITGIGKTPAAVALTRALSAYDDLSGLEVVNIGTAGALRAGISGLFEPGVVVNHDVNADVLRSLGYDPGERIVVGSDPMVLASGDVFVADPDLRDRLAGHSTLVDMEGFAVAYACAAFEIPCRLVKHVSDNAGEDALDWPTLVDRSARVLGEWVSANYAQSGP